MKSRETLIRLKKFQVDERRRRVAQIESMISEFERISSDLERDIKIEQDRPAFMIRAISPIRPMPRRRSSGATTSSARRNDLKVQLEDAKAALGEAFEEMKKVELLDERNQMRERAEDDVGAPTEPDIIAMMGNTARA